MNLFQNGRITRILKERLVVLEEIFIRIVLKGNDLETHFCPYVAVVARQHTDFIPILVRILVNVVKLSVKRMN